MRAVDGGKDKKKASVSVRIYVEQRPASSSAPVFDQKVFQFDPVAGNRRVGQMVGLVSSRDDDKERIWYYIIGTAKLILFTQYLYCSFE